MEPVALDEDLTIAEVYVDEHWFLLCGEIPGLWLWLGS